MTSLDRLPILLFPLLAGVVACGEPSPECTGPGTICTFAGTGEASFDGDGHALAATSFYWPTDLDFSPDGHPYFLDWQNHRVRGVDAQGRVKTVMGGDLPGDGPRDNADMKPEGAPGHKVLLNHPTDVGFLADGTLIVAAWHNHKIRKYDPATGLVHVLCGSTPGDKADHLPAARALLNQPKSLAVDGRGNLYVADSRNQRIRMIDMSAGEQPIDNVAGTGKSGFEGDGATPLEAAFYMQEANENPEPGGSIAVDAQGRIYLADTFNQRVRRIDLAARTVTTVAGNGTKGFSGDGGPATLASLSRPRDVEIGPDGRIYIADTDNHRVRVVDPETGTIATVAGDGNPGFGGDGGSALAASLQRPFGVAFDREGNLYIADTLNNRMRKVVRR